jgi:hypothetical protein
MFFLAGVELSLLILTLFYYFVMADILIDKRKKNELNCVFIQKQKVFFKNSSCVMTVYTVLAF